MGAYTNLIVAKGTKIYALVELDDYATTKSTGGIVKKIYWVLPLENPEDAAANYFTPWKKEYDWDSGKYKAIEVTNYRKEVFVNWIMQDKTGELRDPNS
jgi:hypothetical protein